ncbi:MAG TPA: peptide chain release factor N(5)-glutamine methyltransferase [Casimicrobiaceae bacterium]|jgi:release factor glutamine methyltransferase|nr:peptide chain release factor N(5)-glutamine methyltransferase [Casimicrobiaceae bacterium]
MSTPITVSRALSASGLVPFEAKLLLAHVLGRDRAWLAAHAGEGISAEQAKTFEALARRRRNGEPVAYLIGRREFYGLDLEITPDVLIPRPETELLVELALARLPGDRETRVLDLGTGSGAVALAIAAARRNAQVVSTDVWRPALALAARNAARLGIGNVTFVESDWFDALPDERFDLVAGNPPYVAAGDPHLSEGDLRHEPRQALTPGGDGLSAIRTIVAAAPAHLARGAWLLLEHGHDQADVVGALYRGAGFVDVGAARDLAGIWRVSYGRISP